MDRLEHLALRYVWWQPPTETLGRPHKLLCQILTMGTAEDYLLVRETWGEEVLKEALLTAGPGEVDERSWAFWHRYYGLEERPYPRRSFT
ncbi:MAG TPA: hypothetical protein VFG47_18250 [Geminicoccaceae bacterium]|nr:hypothetical protein [Geminicoccaceae bacterium]